MTDFLERLQAALADRYAIERELGRGGMATVYLAHDLRHDRHVALKILHPELAHAVGPGRFLREIRTAARLQHPHILPVHDSGEMAGQLWYTMPFVAGESLRERLGRESQLPLEDALRIAREMAEALDYAHRHGVVHRDVKPENILLSDGQALLADFGVAKAVGQVEDDKLTGTGLALGTPAYMSPEQAGGSSALDGRSDQYSLGCVLYEMLAGEPPFTGRTPQAVIARRLLEPPPALRLARAAVPEALERVVLRALAREPVDRFRSTAEFAGALSTTSLAGAASSPTAVATMLRSRPSKRLLRLGLATMLGLGAAGSALLWHREAAPAALDADLVAVAPFDVLDPALGLWREGLVDLLSRDLDGAGPLRTVSPTVIVRRWQGRADPASAAALGRRTGAELAIYGSLVRSGTDSLRLAATVLDVKRELALGELEVRGALTDMDRLIDSLAVGVLRELGRTRPVGAVRRTGLGARSLPALRAFLQAEQHYRRGAWDSTRAYAEQAVALDTTFALAYRRLAWAIGWEGDGGDPDPISNEYRERAAALNHGLSPRDSLLVLADSLFQNLDYSISIAGLLASPALGARLFETLGEAVRRYPEDPEAWYTLGEARYHLGVWLVRTEGWRAPLEAFERSIALDSLFAPAYVHPVEASYALGDTGGARRFAAALIRFNPRNDQSRGFQAILRLLALPDSAAQARVLDTLRDPIFWQAYQPLARWPDSSELALRIARHWVRTSHTAEARFHLAHALAFRGHLREALALGDTLSDVVFAEAALLGYVPAERATATFSRWLRLADGPPFLPVPALALPWWSARQDTLALRRFVHVIEGVARPGRPPAAFLPDESARLAAMVTAANAQIALARRDTAAALRSYDSLLNAPCSPWCQTDLLLAGRLLAARGRLDEAARILDAPPMIEGGTTALSPDPRPSDVLWYLERGRVAERLGHRERAIEAYRYVAAAWRRPDPELEPYAAEARAGLARLTAEPAS